MILGAVQERSIDCTAGHPILNKHFKQKVKSVLVFGHRDDSAFGDTFRHDLCVVVEAFEHDVLRPVV